MVKTLPIWLILIGRSRGIILHPTPRVDKMTEDHDSQNRENDKLWFENNKRNQENHDLKTKQCHDASDQECKEIYLPHGRSIIYCSMSDSETIPTTRFSSSATTSRCTSALTILSIMAPNVSVFLHVATPSKFWNKMNNCFWDLLCIDWLISWWTKEYKVFFHRKNNIQMPNKENQAFSLAKN